MNQEVERWKPVRKDRYDPPFLHYSVFSAIEPTHDYRNDGWTATIIGVESLREIFPDGEANDLNFIMFGTSGVHGSYGSLEGIRASVEKYGFEDMGEDWPEDYEGRTITFLVVHPRIVALRYGNVQVTSMDDVEFLEKLASSSAEAIKDYFV